MESAEMSLEACKKFCSLMGLRGANSLNFWVASLASGRGRRSVDTLAGGIPIPSHPPGSLFGLVPDGWGVRAGPALEVDFGGRVSHTIWLGSHAEYSSWRRDPWISRKRTRMMAMARTIFTIWLPFITLIQ